MKTSLFTAIGRPSRNVLILSLCQAIAFSGAPMSLLLGGIVGAELAPSPGLATMPIASMVIGTAIFTIPAALLMKKIGRKRGFILAALASSAAAAGAALSIWNHSFLFFCFMLLVIGAGMAFIAQYRFAAAESVETRYTGRAVSFVLIGGIVAGFLGPEIGRDAKDWLQFGAYTGSFATLAVMFLIAAFLLFFIREIAIKDTAGAVPERPLKAVISQRDYLIASLSSALAFGIMGFTMSATPISMHIMDHFSLKNTTQVIQSHVIAMYFPSLFTGFLVEKLGIRKLQILGILSMGAEVLIAISGHGFLNYLIALVFLGIGWNFLFISGTVMLTRSYNPSERFKAQGFNDFIVFAVQAMATLSAGSVLSMTDWNTLNFISLPFLFFIFVLVLLGRTQLPGSPQPPRQAR